MRNHLPNRRPNISETVDIQGSKYHVTVGFDPVTNKASEVFVHGGKPGSDADAMQYDAGVLVSLLLQHGASPADIRRSLCEREDGSPATVAGAIIEVVANAG